MTADQEALRSAVEDNRQRITLAKAEWESQRAAGAPRVGRDTFRTFLKALVADIIGGRYKRIRQRPASQPDPLRYAHSVERLRQLEALAGAGEVTLFYGDESHVCQQGYVPYGRQFPGEDVFVPAQKRLPTHLLGPLQPRQSLPLGHDEPEHRRGICARKARRAFLAPGGSYRDCAR